MLQNIGAADKITEVNIADGTSKITEGTTQTLTITEHTRYLKQDYTVLQEDN